MKVAYATEAEVKAVLVKDKAAKVAGKAEGSSEAEQYIEVWAGRHAYDVTMLLHFKILVFDSVFFAGMEEGCTGKDYRGLFTEETWQN